ncbi:unnamed protein product, partial [Discosporangium mesarthrocarpum]
VLVFVSSKAGCDELCKSMTGNTPYAAGCIHGDKDQTER